MCSQTNLGGLRRQVDRVDRKILSLIDQRLSLCSEIGKAKGESGRLMLRPKRQKQLVDRVAANAKIASPLVVSHVWRELMAHCLQVQAPTTFVLVRDSNSAKLLRLIREAYGSAAPVTWVADRKSAIEKAQSEQAIAVLASTVGLALPDGLTVFDAIQNDGSDAAWLVGRVSEADTEMAPASVYPISPWQPAGWRRYPSVQLPDYADPGALCAVETRLRQRAPIVELADIRLLSKHLAEVAAGRAILIQGGDCAETFAAHDKGRVHAMCGLLTNMAAVVQEGGERPC